jgi:hypothetical protein
MYMREDADRLPASGGWENYCMAGGHMCISNLFLNNFIKIVSLL